MSSFDDILRLLGHNNQGQPGQPPQMQAPPVAPVAPMMQAPPVAPVAGPPQNNAMHPSAFDNMMGLVKGKEGSGGALGAILKLFGA